MTFWILKWLSSRKNRNTLRKNKVLSQVADFHKIIKFAMQVDNLHAKRVATNENKIQYLINIFTLYCFMSTDSTRFPLCVSIIWLLKKSNGFSQEIFMKRHNTFLNYFLDLNKIENVNSEIFKCRFLLGWLNFPENFLFKLFT